MEEEIWEDVPGYNGDYQVSNLGNVKSLKSGVEKILKKRKYPTGYERVGLLDGKTLQKPYVHNLMYSAFHSGYDIKDKSKKIIHENANRSDNRLENLKLVFPTDRNFYDINRSGRDDSMSHISFDKQNKAYAILFKNAKLGISKHLGYYKDLEEAKRLRDLFKGGLYYKIKPEGGYPGLIHLKSSNTWHVNVFDPENNIYHIDKFNNEQEAKIEWLMYTHLLNRKH